MSTELETKSVEMLVWIQDSLKASLEQGHDFVLEQAPLVVQEFVLFERISRTSAFGAAVMVTILLFIGRWLVMRKLSGVKMSEEDRVVSTTLSWVIPGVISVFTTLEMCFSFGPMLKAWVAPRLLILEEVSRLVSG